MLLKLLTQGWPLKLVNHPANALILADLIFQYQTKDVDFLQEVLTAILNERERFVSPLNVKDKNGPNFCCRWFGK